MFSSRLNADLETVFTANGYELGSDSDEEWSVDGDEDWSVDSDEETYGDSDASDSDEDIDTTETDAAAAAFVAEEWNDEDWSVEPVGADYELEKEGDEVESDEETARAGA